MQSVFATRDLAQLILTCIPPRPRNGWLGLACTCRDLRDEARRCALRIEKDDLTKDSVLTKEQVVEFTEVFSLFAGDEGIISDLRLVPGMFRSLGSNHAHDSMLRLGVAAGLKTLYPSVAPEAVEPGVLRLDTFLSYMEAEFGACFATDLREAFDAVDHDGDGLISEAGLRELIILTDQPSEISTTEAELDEMCTAIIPFSDGHRWRRPGLFSLAAISGFLLTYRPRLDGNRNIETFVCERACACPPIAF